MKVIFYELNRNVTKIILTIKPNDNYKISNHKFASTTYVQITLHIKKKILHNKNTSIIGLYQKILLTFHPLQKHIPKPYKL